MIAAMQDSMESAAAEAWGKEGEIAWSMMATTVEHLSAQLLSTACFSIKQSATCEERNDER